MKREKKNTNDKIVRSIKVRDLPTNVENEINECINLVDHVNKKIKSGLIKKLNNLRDGVCGLVDIQLSSQPACGSIDYATNRIKCVTNPPDEYDYLKNMFHENDKDTKEYP